MRRSSLFALLVASACGPAATEPQPVAPTTATSAPPAPTVDVAASSQSTPSDPPPLAWLEQPRAMGVEERAKQLESLIQTTDTTKIPATPAVGDVGKEVVRHERGKPFVREGVIEGLLFAHEPKPGAKGRPAQSYRRLFSREPTAKLAESGMVTVSWETLRRSNGASVYFGTTVPEDPFSSARHRKRVWKIKSSLGDKRHSAELSFKSLFKPHYDVGKSLQTGRGTVAWRVEALDPEEGTARVYDGRSNFRCEPSPCTRASKLIQTPSLRLGPFVDRPEPTSVYVSWTSDAATRGFVIAHREGGDWQTFPSATPGTRHEVKLSGLAPGERYRYYVAAIDHRGEGTLSSGATFQTAPRGEADFSFVVLSDSRSGQGTADERYAGTNRLILLELLQRSLSYDPSFVVFVGDLVDGYTTSESAFRFELDHWFRAVEPVHRYVPIFEVMGNHEALLDFWDVGWGIARGGASSAEAIFSEYAVNPTNGPKQSVDGAPPYGETVYSFDYGDAHFAVVNSNYWFRSHPDRKDHPAYGKGNREGWIDDVTLKWLDEDLAAAKSAGKSHLFVFTHEPGFPNGGHPQDAMYWSGKIPEVNARREQLFKLMAKRGVSAIFHGDEHNYSRTDVNGEVVAGIKRPIWQLISGGAGAPYYAQQQLPWSPQVARFDARQHFIVVHVTQGRVRAEAVAITGERIDDFDISR